MISDCANFLIDGATANTGVDLFNVNTDAHLSWTGADFPATTDANMNVDVPIRSLSITKHVEYVAPLQPTEIEPVGSIFTHHDPLPPHHGSLYHRNTVAQPSMHSAPVFQTFNKPLPSRTTARGRVEVPPLALQPPVIIPDTLLPAPFQVPIDLEVPNALTAKSMKAKEARTYRKAYIEARRNSKKMALRLATPTKPMNSRGVVTGRSTTAANTAQGVQEEPARDCKARRRAQNRASAQLSRRRKKERVAGLGGETDIRKSSISFLGALQTKAESAARNMIFGSQVPTLIYCEVRALTNGSTLGYLQDTLAPTTNVASNGAAEN